MAMGLLHLALAATLVRYRSAFSALVATAATAAAWTLLFSWEGILLQADVKPWFAFAQFTLIIGVGISVLIPLGRLTLAALLSVALAAGFFEVLRVPGPSVESAFLFMAIVTGAAGVQWREWPPLLAGILGAGAEGCFRGWPLIPRDARGIGILLLAGGFFLFAAGFVVTVLMNRRTVAAALAGPADDGEWPHEASGAGPD
jgi:hypothetical protein